jgi:hypothetical protein
VAIFGNICKQKVITLLTKIEEDITSVGYGYIGKEGVGDVPNSNKSYSYLKNELNFF